MNYWIYKDGSIVWGLPLPRNGELPRSINKTIAHYNIEKRQQMLKWINFIK